MANAYVLGLVVACDIIFSCAYSPYALQTAPTACFFPHRVLELSRLKCYCHQSGSVGVPSCLAVRVVVVGMMLGEPSKSDVRSSEHFQEILRCPVWPVDSLTLTNLEKPAFH